MKQKPVKESSLTSLMLSQVITSNIKLGVVTVRELPAFKVCSKCGRNLPSQRFGFFRNRHGKDQQRACCKQCQVDENRLRRQAKKQREREALGETSRESHGRKRAWGTLQDLFGKGAV